MQSHLPCKFFICVNCSICDSSCQLNCSQRPETDWHTVFTHRSAEEAAARTALVLHHAVAMVLAQNEQLNGVGRTHHFMFHYSILAASQLSIYTLCGHALPVCQNENFSTLGGLHAATAERKLLSLLDRRP